MAAFHGIFFCHDNGGGAWQGNVRSCKGMVIRKSMGHNLQPQCAERVKKPLWMANCSHTMYAAKARSEFCHAQTCVSGRLPKCARFKGHGYSISPRCCRCHTAVEHHPIHFI